MVSIEEGLAVMFEAHSNLRKVNLEILFRPKRGKKKDIGTKGIIVFDNVKCRLILW